jgi:8-oxo-dGTP pyrophosphatase MutT (NUDIX family)
MPSVTIVSFDDTGRVLLVKHRDTDLWVAPGGAIEPEETPADAAVREMGSVKSSMKKREVC